MPTDDDKKSAWIRFEGEARRLLIRRPRFDRDGLYLFGRRYAAQTVTLTAAELQALLNGRVVAVDVVGEYLLYLNVEDGAVDAARSAVAVERPQLRYSERVRVRAAQVRVNAGRRAHIPTPEWIIELAKKSSDETREQ
ncbi:hypothetical protein [Conyzicola nivalis]|nr:hypothetical protein [Conyzicola nivalis]